MERISIITSKERYLHVLEILEQYVVEVIGPCDYDPGYMLTCVVPTEEWGALSERLRN